METNKRLTEIAEMLTLRDLLNKFPNGTLSVVSDTYNIWDVCKERGVLDFLKEQILTRNGKLVIRPDSGNPIDIICGEGTHYTDISKWFPQGDILPEYFEEYLIEEVREETDHGEMGDTEYTQTYKVRGELYRTTIHNISWNRYDKQYYFIDMYDKAEITVEKIEIQSKDKGVVELLWEVFGGTINEQGFKVLDSHVGVIYGDSITLDRAEEICKKLKDKGFASTNVVFGVGSFSLGYATRDNQGSAVKATYVEVNGEGREIFKDPITDDGTKKSAKGLISVVDGVLKDQCTWDEVNSEDNELKVVYLNGELVKTVTMNEIRERLNG